ncbi:MULTISPECIES: DUF6882 domain-containing protein [Corynebacterium]|uniref:DUF6882 domain-containing protein n=1 Tax=Corynebacterium TaxID=1716 RepID=UPI0021A8F831|nr:MULTISPECIES: DUF6882 domain-containing protein [Corynebacterium]MCT1428462.1 hypothetical protein [Corynebacterium sp. p3-SID1241]MDV2431749.1 hypothetical protein [Corynebacterium tuberculostearicum]
MNAYHSIERAADDARFIRTGINAAFRERIGKATDVEFNFLGPSAGDSEASYATDQLVEVRVSSAQHVADFRGVRLAVIAASTWHWTTAATEHFADLPQSGTASTDVDRMVAYASLIVGNMPVLRAQQGKNVAIVAVEFHPYLDFRQTLLRGLQHSSADTDEKEPALALARYLDMDSTEEEPYVHFSDGTTVHFEQASHGVHKVSGITPGLAAARVSEDAFYLSAENQMYFQGNFPDATVELDVDKATATVFYRGGQIAASAVLIATISAEEFTWAWADPELKNTAAARLAGNLARFGVDEVVPELVRPHLPLQLARGRQLPHLALPILGIWTLAGTTLADGRVGLVLLDAPQLHLPEPTPAATEATLEVTPPAWIDADRARAAYGSFRGVDV